MWADNKKLVQILSNNEIKSLNNEFLTKFCEEKIRIF
jgi:hypothetical protein